jgi:hypothetical protein
MSHSTLLADAAEMAATGLVVRIPTNASNADAR